MTSDVLQSSDLAALGRELCDLCVLWLNWRQLSKGMLQSKKVQLLSFSWEFFGSKPPSRWKSFTPMKKSSALMLHLAFPWCCVWGRLKGSIVHLPSMEVKLSVPEFLERVCGVTAPQG